MSCREGRADPEMRSAKRTTLCRALHSWFVALLYHTEIWGPLLFLGGGGEKKDLTPEGSGQ